jgi:hypothetical protein
MEYVDEIMQAGADHAHKEFADMCQTQGLDAEFKVRYGEPGQEIVEELLKTAPHLLITGGKQLNAWGRFRSRNLPFWLQKKVDAPISMLSVSAE